MKPRLLSGLRKRAGDDVGSQLVEFPVALPLLVVLLVGIFDFANAFNLKHKLADAAREGARFASNQPTSDLSQPLPRSIQAVASLVGNVLLTEKVDDCGLATTADQTFAHVPGTLTWTVSASSGACPGTISLEINHGYTFQSPPSSVYASSMTIEATKVTISYPYKWQFNSVISLLVPGVSYASSTQLTTTAIMQNLN